MSVVSKFSSSLGRRDQAPNQLIADEIVKRQDHNLLNEVVDATNHASEKVVNDAIMTLMVVAERNPELLYSHQELFFDLLKSKVNRQVWGSMIVISHLAPLLGDSLFDKIGLILEAMDNGSVVARDHGFSTLTTIYTLNEETLWLLMREQLLKCPPNQFGQYVEKALKVLNRQHKVELEAVIEARLSELTNEHHRTRAIKNLNKIRNDIMGGL